MKVLATGEVSGLQCPKDDCDGEHHTIVEWEYTAYHAMRLQCKNKVCRHIWWSEQEGPSPEEFGFALGEYPPGYEEWGQL